MIRPRYSLMIDDMRAVQNNLEDTYANAQAGIEASAMSLYEKDPVKAKEFLTNYSCMTAESAIDSWKKLGEFLIVKYNDGAVKRWQKMEPYFVLKPVIALLWYVRGIPKNFWKNW